MILLDTSVLIDHLRGETRTTARLREALTAGVPLVASVLTKAEIWGPVRSGEKTAVRAVFSVVDWLAVSEEAADRAGELARQFRRSHRSVDVVDFVIAATAQLQHAELWTRNVRHFPMFADLRPPY